ncbi:MAG: hypothetical protein IPP53_11105 [Bacteroidetes bacterium]|nr:hypothetical protein [Bacteroidota bacterium]
MRVVVDTNIAFSAILNTNSKIGKILLHPKSKINFYSTNNLKLELEKHKVKLKKLSGYSEQDFHNIFTLVLSKIRFINTRRPFKWGVKIIGIKPIKNKSMMSLLKKNDVKQKQKNFEKNFISTFFQKKKRYHC